MSIKRRLLLWLLAVLLAGAGATGAIVYVEARQEANALFDYQLRQVAMSLPSQAFAALPVPRSGVPGVEDGLVVQIWNLRGERLYLSHPDSHLPSVAELGFTTARTDAGQWRIYSALFENVVIQVAQPLRVRSELAAAVALRTVLPLLLVLPVLGLLIWATVGRGMLPLLRVAREVGERSAQALDPLPEDGLPEEVRPLVTALNSLLKRLERALRGQRDFIADAAHELRSPLTALQLQVQLAERANSEAHRKDALEALRAGLSRASHLVEQLLALARAEPDTALQTVERFDLTELTREVLAQMTPLALAKTIDLGLLDEARAWINADREAVRVLVRNLIDNAVRYSPASSRIDVSVEGVSIEGATGQVVLRIKDGGPGIAPAERERVFDRFYRGSPSDASGSGLGLAIVRNIAQRHGAQVALSARPDGQTGLVAEVRFGAAAPANFALPERLGHP